jgi:HD-like signal output (HDOD) protein
MMRVLFVDDEPNILMGLRRLLRPRHNEWEMTFVASGAEALAAMQESPYEVIVTDMKMPGMDGAALLSQVQKRYPRSVRIVLSGHADLEASMRSVQVSHQFLAKPCDAGLLNEVIERACSLQSLLRDTTLQERLGSISDLPVLPRVYRSLTEALADPEVDLGRIAEIVEQDAAITAKLLQLVNSSYFGLRKEVNDLRRATAYLGINTIRDLVLSLEVFRQFEQDERTRGFSIEREQRHALLAARLARQFVKDKIQGEQAFLAAMLHDLGRLVLASHLPEQLARVTQAGVGSQRPLYETEYELFGGICHAEIGGYLLGLWGMPYPIVEAVANHHHPGRVTPQRGFGVLAAVHVAQALAEEQEPLSAARAGVDEEFLASLGVLDQLDGWREIAAREAGSQQEAA